MSVRRDGWTRFLWSKFTLTVATVVIAIAGLVGGKKRPWPWIIASGLFIVAHAAVNDARSQSIVRRLGQRYDLVQRRIVRAIADLGQLSAFDLWMVDLYLPQSSYSFKFAWPPCVRKQKLWRQLSVSLTDARPQPPSVDTTTGPHGECFSGARSLLYLDESLSGDSTDHIWPNFGALNAEQKQVYGVLMVMPVVDQLGRNCVGVLAVHVGPDPVKVLKALAVVRETEGFRRIHDACVDLNGLLNR